MSSLLRQSTAAQARWIGPFRSSTDGSYLTSGTPTVTISKDGAAFAALGGTIGAVQASSMALVTFNATDSNTLKMLKLRATLASSFGADDQREVVSQAVYDQTYSATAAPTVSQIALGVRDQAIAGAAAGTVGKAIADILATSDKYLTAIELDGAVYRFTVNALEQGPTGAGGVADWTAGERQHIRHRLGIDGPPRRLLHRRWRPDRCWISVGVLATAIKAKTDNLPTLPAAVGSAMTLTVGERNSIADALLDRANAVETGWTLRQVCRILASVLGGKSSGDGKIFRAIDDSKVRVNATVDATATARVWLGTVGDVWRRLLLELFLELLQPSTRRPGGAAATRRILTAIRAKTWIAATSIRVRRPGS